MIAVSNVAVQAGSFALSAVSFTIPSGEFGVVVGAAGAGKTTLLEVIAGVRALATGTVTLHSDNVTSWPAERRSVGLVYQRGALFPHKSVRENVGWSGANAEVIAPIMEQLGIENLLTTPVASLSGGERQLVALARALVRVRNCQLQGEQPVLLLDEPFSALDPRRKRVTRDVVHALHREWKLTTLHVTHDGLDARRADIAVLLDAGRVVQSGSPQELLDNPARHDVGLFLGADGSP
ncbi:MAG: ABC transporter ATP-binding protein [Phycisphaerae bacterium]|nr:ABC transporter ATP-binding protein [Gemmatimonadaceae bacterium]